MRAKYQILPEFPSEHANIQLGLLLESNHGARHWLNVEVALVRVFSGFCHSINAQFWPCIEEVGVGPENAWISGQTAGHVQKAGRRAAR